MLDADEYLHLAIHASSVGDRHACMTYLKQVLLRQPRNVPAIHLLAVQHAELGLVGRAVAGLKEALALDPKLDMAQFQLAWLLLNAGRNAEAKEAFAKLKTTTDEAMRAYSEAMIALADDNVTLARTKLTAGLARKSGNPNLAALMQQLLDNLASPPQSQPSTATPAASPPQQAKPSDAPAFLGAYAKRPS